MDRERRQRSAAGEIGPYTNVNSTLGSKLTEQSARMRDSTLRQRLTATRRVSLKLGGASQTNGYARASDRPAIAANANIAPTPMPGR